MPYIPQDQRPTFEPIIAQAVEALTAVDDDQAKGQLNYLIFSIIQRYLANKGMRYSRAQDFIGGVLSCCQMELYRRLLAPYEDQAVARNGDVIPPAQHEGNDS